MMQAGKYYIGDLCYVMHDAWDEFCNLTINGHDVLDGEFNLKDGRRFATYTTMYGDGVYRSNIGTNHMVDAGLIGCIRVDDINDDTYQDLTRLGAVVEFDTPFETWSVEGTIHFGHVRIDTADGEEDYDYSDDEE